MAKFLLLFLSFVCVTLLFDLGTSSQENKASNGTQNKNGNLVNKNKATCKENQSNNFRREEIHDALEGNGDNEDEENLFKDGSSGNGEGGAGDDYYPGSGLGDYLQNLLDFGGTGGDPSGHGPSGGNFTDDAPAQGDYYPYQIGVRNATFGQFPYYVLIVKDVTGEIDSIIGGGSIMNKRWILSSGECVIQIKGQEIILAGAIDGSSGVKYSIERWVLHPKFSLKHYFNDIGLIKVTEPISFNLHVQPIQISPYYVRGGYEVVLASWGIKSCSERYKCSTNLQSTTLKSLSYEDCTRRARGYVTDKFLCTYTCPMQRSCVSESGSPLVLGIQQIGVVSGFSIKCHGKGSPDYHTRLLYYLKWIKSTMIQEE